MYRSRHNSFNPYPIRARAGEVLSMDQIRAAAPSVFADDAHSSRSERYTFIPSVNIVEGLIKHGFQPVAASQSRTRDEGQVGYTRHMLRFRPAGVTLSAVGQELAEIVLVNSHNGTSAYELSYGMFRLACLNGLMVPTGIAECVKVPHKGDVIGRVIEGAFSVIESADRVNASRDAMKALTLSDREQEVFANAALVARYGEPEAGAAFPVTASQVLRPRRFEDRSNDLWTTFNRVQESLVQRGGLSTRSTNGRRMTTRPVTGIPQNVALNRALWTLADQMAKLKTGEALAA